MRMLADVIRSAMDEGVAVENMEFEGEVLEGAVRGAQGMTDAGAREVFFAFNALERYPEAMYLSNGRARLRVR